MSSAVLHINECLSSFDSWTLPCFTSVYIGLQDQTRLNSQNVILPRRTREYTYNPTSNNLNQPFQLFPNLAQLTLTQLVFTLFITLLISLLWKPTSMLFANGWVSVSIWKENRTEHRCAASHLSWVLIDNPDHGRHSALLLNQVQTGSVGVRSVSQPVLPVEVSRINVVPKDRLSCSFKHWNLAHDKKKEEHTWWNKHLYCGYYYYTASKWISVHLCNIITDRTLYV